MKKIFIFIMLIFMSCTPQKFSIQSIETGSDLYQNGKIKNEFLTYKFTEPSKKKNVQDLFNHLYFAGDTLCFSIKHRGKVKKDEVKVYFVNPANGKEYKAERIDINDGYISGFSLVGTVMEQFYKKDLEKPIPEDKYCCKPIKFQLKIEIMGPDKFVNSITAGRFEIKYEKNQE